MKIVFLGNNRTAARLLDWLVTEGEELVGVVVHPPGNRKHEDLLLAAARRSGAEIIDSSKLADPTTFNRLVALRPEMAISVQFGYKLSREFLSIFPLGAVNLHFSLLPHNRGAHPNIWTIVEGTPGGVTLHYIDETIDTGDIIVQRAVPVEPIDTGKSLYCKLESEAETLFLETWHKLKRGPVERVGQPRLAGAFHKDKDLEKIDCVDLDRDYKGRQLIDILRARTFDRYPGAYFVESGRRIYMKLHLSYDPGDTPGG